MGVHGFESYLDRELERRELERRELERSELERSELQEPLPRDGPCLVDGSSLAYYLLDVLSEAQGEHLHKKLGGVYEAATAATETFLKRLLENTQEIWVVADGETLQPLKADTKARRRREREKRFWNLYEYFHRGERPRSHKNLPPPPLWREQVYATVASMQQIEGRIHLLRAAGEADQLLAAMCSGQVQLGQAEGPAFILGQDTDFHFVANIRYVPLKSLQDGRFRVYTRARLADVLRVREDAMTELALAIGNDYVEGWGMGPIDWWDRVPKIVEYFRGRGRALLTTVTETNLVGTTFSQNFYNNSVVPDLANDVPAFRRISSDYESRPGILPDDELQQFALPPGHEDDSTITKTHIVMQMRALKFFCTRTVLENVPEMDLQAHLQAPSAEAAIEWVDRTVSDHLWPRLAQSGIVNLNCDMAKASWDRYCVVYAYQLLYSNVVRRVMPVSPSAASEALPGMDITSGAAAMGVPGFASYLERELAGRKPPLQEVPRDGPCLVDGSGLAFYLLKELGKDAHRDLGGVYEAARAATKAFLRRLLATTREIWVVADGKASHEAMAATKTRRKLAREEKFYKLYAYLELGEAPASHDDLPVPPLWMDQFYATVDSVQREMQDRAHPDSGPIHLLRAAGEADELLAAMCQNLAQTQSHQAAGAFILAQDTDFYFVANARYVPLNSLENGCCRVYTRAWLADALRVPDHAMTELALAIGNDYVEGWNIKMRSAAERVAVIVKKFRKGQNRVRAVPSFIAKSDGAKFSRVFYNNKVFPNFNFANDIPKPHQEKPAFRRISADGKLRDLIDLPPFVGSAGGKLTTSQVVAQVRTLQWFCTETILEKVPEMDLEAVSAETALAWVDATISKMWASFAQVGLVNLKYHMTMRSWNRYCAVYAYQLLYYNLVRRVMPVAPSATCEALPGMDVTKCGLSDARRFPLMAQCRADCEVQALRCISRKLPKDWKQVREPLTLLSAAAAAATSKSHAKGLRKPLTPRRAKRDHRLQVSPGPKEKANYWGPLAESSDDDEDDR